jgi:hypothetical protein
LQGYGALHASGDDLPHDNAAATTIGDWSVYGVPAGKANARVAAAYLKKRATPQIGWVPGILPVSAQPITAVFTTAISEPELLSGMALLP